MTTDFNKPDNKPDKPDKMTEIVKGNITYLCPRAPNTQIKIEKIVYVAKDGVLSLAPEIAEKLDEMMKTRPDISALFRKVDMEHAVAAMKAHQENYRRAAVTGPFASDSTTVGQTRNAQHAQSNEALTGKSNPVREEPKKDIQDVKPIPHHQAVPKSLQQTPPKK